MIPRRREPELLAAATRVFYARGYSGATVQDIADELGILKGSLYHYIETKEDLLFRVLEDVHDDVEAILADLAQTGPPGALDRVEEYVRRQVLHNLTNLMQISVYYYDLERLGPDRRELLRARSRPVTAFVRARIAEAQRQGLVDPALDLRVLTSCVFGTLIWTYRWYRPGGRWTPEHVADHCARFAVQGLTGRPAQDSGA